MAHSLGFAWAPVLSIFVVGVVFTVVRVKRDSVASSFLMHCGYNLALFSATLVQQRSLPSSGKGDRLKWYREDMAGSSREQLLTLLAEKSFRLGQFKLSSGGTSDYYIDCRLTTLDAPRQSADRANGSPGD